MRWTPWSSRVWVRAFALFPHKCDGCSDTVWLERYYIRPKDNRWECSKCRAMEVLAK